MLKSSILLTLLLLSSAYAYEHIYDNAEAVRCLKAQGQNICVDKNNLDDKYCCGLSETAGPCWGLKTICSSELSNLGGNAEHLLAEFGTGCGGSYTAPTGNRLGFQSLEFTHTKSCIMKVKNGGENSHTLRFYNYVHRDMDVFVYEKVGTHRYEARGEIKYPSSSVVNPNAIDFEIKSNNTAYVVVTTNSTKEARFDGYVLSFTDADFTGASE